MEDNSRSSITYQSLNEEMHPLDNPVIMENVFSHLPLKDLRIARFVNKFWLDLSLTEWRSTATISVSDTESGNTVGIKAIVGNTGDPKVDSLLYKIRDKPYQRYRLYSGHLRLTLPEKPENADNLNFWNTLGPRVKYLELTSITYFPSEGYLEGLEWLLLEKCPNLEELLFGPRLWREVEVTKRDKTKVAATLKTVKPSKLHSLKFNYYQCQQNGTFFMQEVEFFRELFNLIPNLKSLKFALFFQPGYSFSIANLLSALSHPLASSSSKTRQYIQLRALTLPILDKNDLDILRKYVLLVSPPLTRFATHFLLQTDVPLPEFISLIDSLSGKLQRLRLFTCRRYFLPELGFSDCGLTDLKFPELTYLSVEASKSGNISFGSAGHFRFDLRALNGMPKLRVFCFYSRNDDETDGSQKRSISPKDLIYWGNEELSEEEVKLEIDRSVVKLETLEEFCYVCGNCALALETISILGRIFPGLKVYKGVLNGEVVNKVFNTWPKLESVKGLEFEETAGGRKNVYVIYQKSKNGEVEKKIVNQRDAFGKCGYLK